jgi:uncharacterized protein with PQ loop repeat
VILSTADVLAVLATVAGLVMAVAPSLQIRRIRRTRSSRDVSLLYLTFLDIGFISFIAYGWAIGNPVLLITNLASITFMTITILVALAYRRAKGPDRGPVPASGPADIEQTTARP